MFDTYPPVFDGLHLFSLLLRFRYLPTWFNTYFQTFHPFLLILPFLTVLNTLALPYHFLHLPRHHVGSVPYLHPWNADTNSYTCVSFFYGFLFPQTRIRVIVYFFFGFFNSVQRMARMVRIPKTTPALQRFIGDFYSPVISSQYPKWMTILSGHISHTTLLAQINGHVQFFWLK